MVSVESLLAGIDAPNYFDYRLVPLNMIPVSQRQSIFRTIGAQGVVRALQLEIAKKPEELVVRDLVTGDSASTDFRDLDVLTSATAGLEWWAQDSADLTAGNLSTVLATGETINDNTVVTVGGCFDLTEVQDLVGLRLYRGSSPVVWWETEAMYVGEESGGLMYRVITFDAKDGIKMECNFKNGDIDHYVGLYAAITEKFGTTIAP